MNNFLNIHKLNSIIRNHTKNDTKMKKKKIKINCQWKNKVIYFVCESKISSK